MKHDIHDWVSALIAILPFLGMCAAVIFVYVRFKKGRYTKEWSPKRLFWNLLLWVVAALVLVVVLNLFQSARTP
jgi:hypothetical protein